MTLQHPQPAALQTLRRQAPAAQIMPGAATDRLPSPRAGEPLNFRTALLARALGSGFRLLPGLLQQFFAVPRGQALGTLRVARGPGRMANLAANLLQLPAAEEALPVRVERRTVGSQEQWVSQFHGAQFRSTRCIKNSRLTEKVGPLRLALQVQAHPEGLQVQSAGARIFGLPLPRLLTPQVLAVLIGCGSYCWLHLQVEAPALGVIFCAQGEIRPVPL